jgi:hypothetical protein
MLYSRRRRERGGLSSAIHVVCSPLFGITSATAWSEIDLTPAPRQIITPSDCLIGRLSDLPLRAFLEKQRRYSVEILPMAGCTDHGAAPLDL